MENSAKDKFTSDIWYNRLGLLFFTSFTNWDGIGAEFVGLENYSKLLNKKSFIRAIFSELSIFSKKDTSLSTPSSLHILVRLFVYLYLLILCSDL